MSQYETIIGLEIHAELNTASKIYCSCRNSFSRDPNTQVCPICMGFPGTLPTLNRAAVEYAIRMGHALNCRINAVSRQDRKNYFYPDLPKGYQISQADVPLCTDGSLDFMVNGHAKTVRIERIHIEEDAGKLLHDGSGSGSLADFNRCGVPLIEIVTMPDLRSSEEARAFLDTIKAILQFLGISDCKMQEGSIRCDVNVSVRRAGMHTYGTRCEMKNVNSFSAAVRAIEYEAERQIALLASGGTVGQETRRWDDSQGKSILMRSKENAQDYRYFPEPDLLTICVPEKTIAALRESIPELPNAKEFRYIRDFGLSPAEAVLIGHSPDKSRLFDECTALNRCNPKNAANWILADVSKYMNDTGSSILDTCMTAERLTELIALVEAGTISNSAGKTVFQEILIQDKAPAALIEELGLAQNSDTKFLTDLAEHILKINEKSVNDYHRGKTNALGYLIGQCMKASGGRANPGLIREIVLKKLNEQQSKGE